MTRSVGGAMDVSQGRFNVRRGLDGRVHVTCPPVMIVTPQMAVRIARAILQEAGVEVVLADPGQTVIRPPAGGLQ